MIKSDLEECIQKIAPVSERSFSRNKNNLKAEDLGLILSCFNQDNEFNILQFKKILHSIHEHKQDEYMQKLIEELERLCHDAIIFSLAKNKKIKLTHPSY